MNGINKISQSGDKNDLIDFAENVLEGENVYTDDLKKELSDLRNEYENSENNIIDTSKEELHLFESNLLEYIVKLPQELLFTGLVQMITHWAEKESWEQQERENNRIESPEDIINKVYELDNENDFMEVTESYLGDSDYVIIWVPQTHSVPELNRKIEFTEYSDAELYDILSKGVVQNKESIVEDKVEDAKIKYSLNELERKDIIKIGISQHGIRLIGDLLISNKLTSIFGMEGRDPSAELDGNSFQENGIPRKEFEYKDIKLLSKQGIDYLEFTKGGLTVIEIESKNNQSIRGVEDVNLHQEGEYILNFLNKIQSLSNKKYQDTLKDLIENDEIRTYYYEYSDLPLSLRTKVDEILFNIKPEDLLDQDKFLSRLDEIREIYVYNKRQENVVKNIDLLMEDTGSNSIMIPYGSSHFDISRDKEFQELCKEKGISYMVIEPGSI